MNLLLKNGYVITMAGEPIENCDILIEGKYIKQIAPNIKPDNDTKVIDVTGLTVMPGLIEAHCHIGISEERKGEIGDDCNETSSPITPHLRGIDAINPMDAAFSNAVAAGITAVNVGPGSSNILGGTFVLIKTGGSRKVDDLVVLQPSAMKAAFGENPKVCYGGKEATPSTRMAIAGIMREQLTKAKAYWKAKGDVPYDFRMESLVPVFEKKIPLKCHVHRTDDIFTAIRIAKEFDINIILLHCTEGHLIAKDIKESGYPAIVGPGLAYRNKLEVENLTFKTPGILNRNGVLVSITTDHPVSVIQTLPLCAGLAVKEGMDYYEGLKAVTINPAKILDADRFIGSLKPGKDADIAVFDGNPLDLFTNCIYTIINGELVYQYESPEEKKDI